MVLVVLGVCLVTLAGVMVEVSSEKHVAFPTTIPTQKSSPADFLPISIKLSRAAIGQTTTIGLKRGGQATTTALGSVSEGFVGFRKTPARASTATVTPTNASAGPVAGSRSSTRGLGEQQSTLSGGGN
jgi:hypothetical protein